MAELINDMLFDDMGGVDIKKNYTYYTYNNTTTETGYTSENVYSGEYVVLLKNTNDNYEIDVEDVDICLTIQTGVTIQDWFINYINAYVISGATNQYNNKILYSIDDNMLYKIQHTGSTVHQADISEMWAITDESGSIWGGIGSFLYNEILTCNPYTERWNVKLKNINELSETAFTIRIFNVPKD